MIQLSCSMGFSQACRAWMLVFVLRFFLVRRSSKETSSSLKRAIMTGWKLQVSGICSKPPRPSIQLKSFSFVSPTLFLQGCGDTFGRFGRYGPMPKLIGVNRGCKPYARTLCAHPLISYNSLLFPMISYCSLFIPIRMTTV